MRAPIGTEVVVRNRHYRDGWRPTVEIKAWFGEGECFNSHLLPRFFAISRIRRWVKAAEKRAIRANRRLLRLRGIKLAVERG